MSLEQLKESDGSHRSSNAPLRHMDFMLNIAKGL